MKNNTQRKEWLADYRSWGVWYADKHIGVVYYKYDFDNGAKLIVEEYEDTLTTLRKTESVSAGIIIWWAVRSRSEGRTGVQNGAVTKTILNIRTAKASW